MSDRHTSENVTTDNNNNLVRGREFKYLLKEKFDTYRSVENSKLWLVDLYDVEEFNKSF